MKVGHVMRGVFLISVCNSISPLVSCQLCVSSVRPQFEQVASLRLVPISPRRLLFACSEAGQ